MDGRAAGRVRLLGSPVSAAGREQRAEEHCPHDEQVDVPRSESANDLTEWLSLARTRRHSILKYAREYSGGPKPPGSTKHSIESEL
jgi:hypothetical protein